MSVIITVEGVLRKPAGGQEIQAGIELLGHLAAYSAIFLADEDPDEARDWLKGKGAAPDLVLRRLPDRVAQVREIQFAYGYPVEFCVEPDPAVVRLLLEEGYRVLGFFDPYFARPEWRPGFDQEIRPWDELSRQAADAARLHAGDERLRRREE